MYEVQAKKKEKKEIIIIKLIIHFDVCIQLYVLYFSKACTLYTIPTHTLYLPITTLWHRKGGKKSNPCSNPMKLPHICFVLHGIELLIAQGGCSLFHSRFFFYFGLSNEILLISFKQFSLTMEANYNSTRRQKKSTTREQLSF